MFHNLREGGIVRQLAPGISARIFPVSTRCCRS